MRKLLITLVVLAGVGVGLDRAALVFAERGIATQARSSGGLTSEPAVSIAGFPFLTQVLRGSLDDVRLTATDVVRGGLRLGTLTANLRDVQVPLQQALSGTVDAVPVAGIDATAVLAYADLAAAQGRGFTVTPAGNGLVRVTGRLTVLGQSVAAAAVSSVRLDGRSVVLTARRIEVGGIAANAGMASAIGAQLDVRVPIPALPYGLRLTGLTAGPDALLLTARSGPTLLR